MQLLRLRRGEALNSIASSSKLPLLPIAARVERQAPRMRAPALAIVMKPLMIVALLTCSPAHAQVQSPLTPGAWKLVTRVTALSAKGVSETPLREELGEWCMTSEFIATDPYVNPAKDNRQAGNGECRTSKYDRTDGTATWLMTCKVPSIGWTESAIRATVAEREFRNEMTTTVSRIDAPDQTIRLVTTGHYVGECQPDMKRLTP